MANPHRLQLSYWRDSILPRHALVNNIVLDENAAGFFETVDWEALASDLATAYETHWANSAPLGQLEVKVYEIGPPPQYPKHVHMRREGVTGASLMPREIALCLSFFAERNLPRQRGRLYLPRCARTGAATLRPTVADRTAALDFADALAGLGGIDIDWCIWSGMDNMCRPVTHAWVDDEWDTQRRRGLDATTRDERATGA